MFPHTQSPSDLPSQLSLVESEPWLGWDCSGELLGGNSKKKKKNKLQKFPVGLFRLGNASKSLSPTADLSPPSVTSAYTGFGLKFGCLRPAALGCCVSRVVAGWFLDVPKS